MARRSGPSFPLGIPRSGGVAIWFVLCLVLALLGRAISSEGDSQGFGSAGEGRRDLQFGRGLNRLRGLKAEELAGAGDVGKEAVEPPAGSPVNASDKNPAVAALGNATLEAAVEVNGTVPLTGSPMNTTAVNATAVNATMGAANQTTTGADGTKDDASLGPVTIMSAEDGDAVPATGDKPTDAKPTDAKATDPKATDPKAVDPKDADPKAIDPKDAVPKDGQAAASATGAGNATSTEGPTGTTEGKDGKEGEKPSTDKDAPVVAPTNATAAEANGGAVGEGAGKKEGEKEGEGKKEGEAGVKPGEKDGKGEKEPQGEGKESKGEGKEESKGEGKGDGSEEEGGVTVDDDTEPSLAHEQSPKDDKDGKKEEKKEEKTQEKKDDKTTPVTNAETKVPACDPKVKCHGHGSCDAQGLCVCHPPWSGPTCLHNDCADVEDCLTCATQMRRDDASVSLGCYWSDGECRGDGAHSPDVDICSADGWFGGAWAYLQYVFLALLVLGGGGLLYLRASRNGGLTGGPGGSQFQRIPIGSSGHGPGSNREEWGWDPEEDNVELLHPATAASSSTSTTADGRPEPYSDRPKETNSARGNGIYSLVRANPLNGQQSGGKDALSGSGGNGTPAPTPGGVGEGHGRGPSSSGAPPSDVDLFAELGMEANPRFKTGAPRGNESPPSSQRNRGSTGRLGLEAVGSGSAGAAWDGDDDIDI